MKTTKMIFPLALAVAVTVSGTGCHKGTPKMTPLPGVTAPVVGGDQTPATNPNNPGNPGAQPGLPPANPITGDQNPVNGTPTPPPSYQNPGSIATSDNWDPSAMNADPAALAANTVHFAFDSAVVKTGEQANIQAVATYLTSNPNDKLMIEGNCDERGTEEYNRSLGERRALALREALDALKVDAKRIRTISYGKDKPVDPGHDEAAFAKNRRGDFVIYHPKTGV